MKNLFAFVADHLPGLGVGLIVLTAYLAGRLTAPVHERVSNPDEAVWSDWHTHVQTNPLGLYIINDGDEDLRCHIDRTVTLDRHTGWWFGGPGPFYECTKAQGKSKATNPVEEGCVVRPTCAAEGEVCYEWHNATILWQWEGKGKMEQWPTVVCDKWMRRKQ